MATINGKVGVDVVVVTTKGLDLTSAIDTLALKTAINITHGTGADQADLIWHDTRTINAATNDDLDLAGVLQDAFGNVLTFARVKLLYVYNKSTDMTLTIGPAASNGFSTPFGGTTPSVNIKPGGIFLLIAPGATAYAVTAGTADQLRIGNAGGSATTYDIAILGASA